MLRSLYTADSGLRAHQTMLDVVGDNIANVNTTGYKSSGTVFEDTLSQEVKAAGAAAGDLGGTNPAQVGLGVRVAAISPTFTQGALQNTGRATDMAIQGDGFFIVQSNTGTLYTRAGSFTLDANGVLTTPDGDAVQGWDAKNGTLASTGTPTTVKLPIGVTIPPAPTSKATLAGNLSADAPNGTSATSSLTTYDSKGVAQVYSLTFQKTDDNDWSMSVTDPSGNNVGTSTITFDSTGKLTSPSSVTETMNGKPVALDISGISGFGGSTTAAVTSQDGNAPGALQSFTVGSDGVVTGVFSNGTKQSLAQVALASFANPAGLEQVDGTMWRDTVNSGDPLIGAPTTGSRGSIASGDLEMSNVDLGQEFSNLIVAERGFQANAKVISASDEVLQDLVNMTH